MFFLKYKILYFLYFKEYKNGRKNGIRLFTHFMSSKKKVYFCPVFLIKLTVTYEN